MEQCTWGLGPRATIVLLKAPKAWSLLFIPQARHAVDEALAKAAAPVLRHRLRVGFDWQEEMNTEDLVTKLLLATAPQSPGYGGLMQCNLASAGHRVGL